MVNNGEITLFMFKKESGSLFGTSEKELWTLNMGLVVTRAKCTFNP